jgi:3-hydroxy-9,10-secoandrosta-1,3,5(10)-triene-9,17-dione monooxygenase reductase component
MADALRSVFRRVPSPVAIITAVARREIRGMTVGSLTSLSLDPPLVSFNVERAAQMFTLLAEASGFAVHLVGVHQAGLCKRFAEPDRTGQEQFASVMYGFDVDGNPLLGGALAALRCRTYARFPAGDHAIIVGEVVESRRQEGDAPLVYYDRRYRGIGGEVIQSRSEMPGPERPTAFEG